MNGIIIGMFLLGLVVGGSMANDIRDKEGCKVISKPKIEKVYKGERDDGK